MISTKRALCLDALRGYAIITMILSGQMVLTHLPVWMAHAQVPPGKSFDPTIFGITWVDLVFPFFLFAMGAAFPLSLGRKLNEKANRLKIVLNLFVRGAMLVYFAIFFQHMKPFVLGNASDAFPNILSLMAFVLMFFMYKDIKPKFIENPKIQNLVTWMIKIIAFIVGFVLLNSLQYEGKSVLNFDKAYSDIIIIVLANMAFFGGVIYVFTYKNQLARLAILPFIMAVFLASQNEGWVKEFYNFSPIPWAYKFYYLKYLFIIIPGSIAGDYLRSWMESNKSNSSKEKAPTNIAFILVFISLSLIVTNVIFLFNRQLFLNFAISAILIGIGTYILKNINEVDAILWKNLFYAGGYCLILGLIFEAYEGGIRKDHSTYSYYFVTSGLAFMALMLFNIICDYFKLIRFTKFLVMSGQNPMIAYVASALIILPLLNLTGLSKYMYVFGSNALMGFLQGLVVTALAVLITMFFTKMKWFWRT